MQTSTKTLQVFEYSRLQVGDGPFKESHFDALSKYHDQFEGKYFTLLHHGVRFKNYVGVIQAGDLTIEILPKADREAPDADEGTWHAVLLEMLQECSWMRVDVNESASLKLKHRSILEAYLELYLDGCRKLLHGGLVRKYRREEGNTYALKGKLLIGKQVSHNAVHQERFFVDYTVYDRNNLFNRILLKGLRLVRQIAPSVDIRSKAESLMLDWPELPDIQITESHFERMVFDRKTDRYRSTMLIAKMLLLNYRPDITGGTNHVLAILFDMNKLWEEFIYRRTQHALYDNGLTEWEISAQQSKDFWKQEGSHWSKTVRPDLVLENATKGEILVLDTKWKLPDYYGPSDEDLKQMLVYNLYWQCRHSYLVYPRIAKDRQAGSYHDFEDENGIAFHSQCSLVSVQVLSGQVLSESIGEDILVMIGIKPGLRAQSH